MFTISTDRSKQIKWYARRANDQTVTISFVVNDSAFDISDYTFTLGIYRYSDFNDAIISLTEGVGLTNGGATGQLTIIFTDTQLTITPEQYFIRIAYTYSGNNYLLFNGIFELNDELFDGVTSSETVTVNLGETNVTANVSLINNYQPNSNFIFVNTTADLPDAVNNVITLNAGVTYYFTDEVDLSGSRLVASANTTILGASSENCRIKSTGLNASTALITSEYSLPIRNITIEHGTALNLDATNNANQALDWSGVNFTDCATIGTIKSYDNFIAIDCGILNSANFTFDGTIGTVGFLSTIFDGRSGQTTLIFPATLTITRRIRLVYCPFVSLSGETSISVNASATIPVESYILDTCNFSGGGTYISGVQHTDNKALFQNNKGIENSAEICYYTMNGNVTVTDIVTQGVEVKIAGTTTSSAINQKFTHTNNRATYVGAITRNFKVTATATVLATTNNQIGIYVAKNGSVITQSEVYGTANSSNRAENITVQSVVSLAQNDYVEIFVENNTNSSDVTVSSLSTIIESLN